MKVLRALAATATAAILTALFWPASARGQEEPATVTEIGWWSRNPAAAAPPNGFQVAQAPDGDLTVSAIRIRLTGTTLLTARLGLGETQIIGTPTLQVCPTTAPWTPAAHDFASAPKPDCASPIPLQRNEAAREWFADVLSFLASGGEVSLMIVPAPDPANPTPLKAPFQADFASASLIATTGEVPSSDTGGGGGGGEIATGDFSLPSDSGLSVVPTAPAVEDLAGGAFTAPPDLDPAAAPAAAAPAQVPGRFPVRATTDDDGGSSQPWGRLPLVILGSAIIGAGTAVARQRLQALGWLPASSS